MTLLLRGERTTPVGRMAWFVGDDGLRVLGFDPAWVDAYAAARGWRAGGADEGPVGAALDAFFGGTRTALEALPARPEGTPFQREVWEALRRIPPGGTTTYGQIARDLERPRAIRAVGAAVGANPVALVIPCHRVIGADGELTGYAGGLGRKRWLLEHERGGQVPLF